MRFDDAQAEPARTNRCVGVYRYQVINRITLLLASITPTLIVCMWVSNVGLGRSPVSTTGLDDKDLEA